MTEPPSLEALLAQSEQVEQRVLADKRQLAGQVIHAQDDWGLVEIGVSGTGRIVEVAINTARYGDAQPAELAEAVLQAARAAQDAAETQRTRRFHAAE
ncbi:MAG TPA: YbaB/EbfC family nucleoid-associated protein [Amycolatopsis sp.]|nr:YbaB/EbfC family nucleoid-associated protein [Amycolatopsis sp.]